MNQYIDNMLAALNEISVNGKKNHELLLGCIMMTEKLKKELEGVYHGCNGKEQEVSGEGVLSAVHSSGTDDPVR